MDSATSPTGEKHPGQIEHSDKVDGRTWTQPASKVPSSIAWVAVAGTWKAVTKIEITGSKERRCITKFGADGEMLETTMTSPLPPR